MDKNSQPLIEFVGIGKEFPGVKALENVSFSVAQGEVHALVGENGAGKTTLINIIAGALQPNSGQILLKGQEVKIKDPSDAYRLGISTVSQEFKLCNNLTVTGNIFLGREIKNNQQLLDWDTMDREAGEMLASLGLPIDPQTPVGELRVSQQQMTEIAKAFSWKANLIIMDEPTSALTEHEAEILFSTIRLLKSQGITIIYVSHRLEEVFKIADRITVLRDGQQIKTLPIGKTNITQIIAMMIGREVESTLVEVGEALSNQAYLSVSGLTKAKKFYDIDLEVHPGEVVSIFGLQGSGKSELAQAIFGLESYEKGQILIENRPVKIKSPSDAIRCGLGYAPSDRRRDGLVLPMMITENIAMASLPQFSKFGFINTRKLHDYSKQYKEKIDIVCSSLYQQISDLSGGNQQKVVVARLLAAKPRILILDEPTRGIDVGAKTEIYKLLRELAKEGLGVLIISSELPEVQKVSDRIVVMHDGRITGRFTQGEASSEQILSNATGARSFVEAP